MFVVQFKLRYYHWTYHIQWWYVDIETHFLVIRTSQRKPWCGRCGRTRCRIHLRPQTRKLKIHDFPHFVDFPSPFRNAAKVTWCSIADMLILSKYNYIRRWSSHQYFPFLSTWHSKYPAISSSNHHSEIARNYQLIHNTNIFHLDLYPPTRCHNSIPCPSPISLAKSI